METIHGNSAPNPLIVLRGGQQAAHEGRSEPAGRHQADQAGDSCSATGPVIMTAVIAVSTTTPTTTPR